MTTKKQRLDQLLVAQGLFDSRQKAQRAIMAGWVLVEGQLIDKSSHLVSPKAQFQIKQKSPFASRGGLKLQAAFEAWNLNVKQKICVDLGASTGGFTDCLLKHGAFKVYAIDVGYGQLSYKLRENPKVICREKINARYLSAKDFEDPITFLTADLSFISLKKILPAIKNILVSEGEGVLLIKPQFEAKREEIKKGGVVKDAAVHQRILNEIQEEAQKQDFQTKAPLLSPIKGPAGNQEYLLWIKHLA